MKESGQACEELPVPHCHWMFQDLLLIMLVIFYSLPEFCGREGIICMVLVKL